MLPKLSKMASAAPKGEKTMSSRLLTMKFMQRAAAAAAAKSAPENIEVPDAKRTKATIDSGLVSGLPAGALPPADMGAISAAVQEEEGKRAAAIERQAADAGETHWVIDFPASTTQETEHYHYQYILPGTEANVDAFVDENRAGGRKRFGGYKKQESEKPKPKIMPDSPKEEKKRKRRDQDALDNVISLSGRGGTQPKPERNGTQKQKSKNKIGFR